MKRLTIIILSLLTICMSTLAMKSSDGEDVWHGAQWIALQEDSALIVPGVHIPYLKKVFGDKKPGMYRMPEFKRDFKLKGKVKSASLTICGLGHFEACINGRKVGNHFLDPGWTMFDKEAEYVVFDVKDMLTSGNNTMKVLLGNGFYNIPRQGYTKLVQSYGAPKLKALLHIEMENGKTVDIPTDLEWMVQGSPITFSSIYAGETYDARLENANDWHKPVITKNDACLKLQQQAVTFHEVLAPKIKRNISENVCTYDFGQNVAGIPSLTIKGKPGEKVRLLPAELQKADGTILNHVAPKYALEYIIGDTLEHTWSPRFSYVGFRYLQVERSAADIACSDVKLIATYADMKEVGSFECSDTLLNKIHALIDWAIKSNTQSISTDCPTREKLGWLEQTYLMQESMMYRYDMRYLFRKIMSDMACSQHQDGCVPTIAPEYVAFGDLFGDTPEWGSAFIIVPWKYYLWYGDDSLFRQYYDDMLRYLEYLESKTISSPVSPDKRILAYGLGDWYDIGPKNPGFAQLTSEGVTTTATLYYDIQLLRKMSGMLGKTSEEKKLASLADNVYDAYNATFLKHRGDSVYYDRNSQCANAISLCMGLVPVSLRAGVAESLAEGVKADGNTAGDVGYRYVLEALSTHGHNDLIYNIATTTDKPSYAYQLMKGATSLTESWQALPTVSNNHLMLGHLMQWLYGTVGGIRQADDSKAWEHIIIAPIAIHKDFACNTSLNTPHGLVLCDYHVNGSSYKVVVDIPQGSRATILLPDGKSLDIGCGHYEYAN